VAAEFQQDNYRRQPSNATLALATVVCAAPRCLQDIVLLASDLLHSGEVCSGIHPDLLHKRCAALAKPSQAVEAPTILYTNVYVAIQLHDGHA
jgi:hypothetical protein